MMDNKMNRRMMNVSGGLASLAMIAASAGKSFLDFSNTLRVGMRQAARGRIARHLKITGRLNRARRWPYAETYLEARKLSPFPDRPVR